MGAFGLGFEVSLGLLAVGGGILWAYLLCDGASSEAFLSCWRGFVLLDQSCRSVFGEIDLFH